MSPEGLIRYCALTAPTKKNVATNAAKATREGRNRATGVLSVWNEFSAHITLLQITQICGDRLDLRLRQAMRDWLHHRGDIGLRRLLAALLIPVRQFVSDVVVQLARQAREWPVPFGLGTVT